MKGRSWSLKVLAAVVVSMVLVVGSPSVAQDGTFGDDDGNVHEQNIEFIAAKGVTRGCNPPLNDKYCPSDRVTRGQMAAFLVRALNLERISNVDTFVDDDESVFEADIEALYAAGITKGCNPPVNDRFCPDSVVRREVMAAFLTRAFDLPAGPEGFDFFVDDDDSIFERDIETLLANSITASCNPPDNDRFCPTDPVRRDQMASFLARSIRRYPPDRTEVGGILKSNTTWTVSGSPYYVSSTIQIPVGVTLTIEPGVRIVGEVPERGALFLLYGSIIAEGTVGNPIEIDGALDGNSGPKTFFDSTGSDHNASLVMTHSIVEDGGRLWQGGPASLLLRNSRLRGVSTTSQVNRPSGDIFIEYNVFEDSAGFSVAHDADAGVYIRWNRIEGFVDPGTAWVSNWASTGSGQTIVLGNSFLIRPAIAVELPPGYAGADLDARENYWGTTNTGVIDQMIFDQNDSITSAGIIPYLPILTAPHPDAP